MPVQEPNKELRFTRAAQALPWFILSAILFTFTVVGVIFFAFPISMKSQLFTAWWWIIIPSSILCFFTTRIAIRCAKHAYLLLTPLGIEIFPFFKPEKNLRVIYWQEIHSAEMDEKEMRIHFNAEHSAGVILSLKPIPQKRIKLLKKALLTQLDRQEK